jgi:hypothetical protein
MGFTSVRSFIAGLLGALTWAGLSSMAIALTEEQRQLVMSWPPNLQLLNPNAIPPDSPIITPFTISSTELTIPSLWWADEQFGREILTAWIAFPALNGLPPRVDLIVSEAAWREQSYWQRYAFVNKFGRESKTFGYIVRVFNEQRPQPRILAAYLCDNSWDRIDGEYIPQPVQFADPEEEANCQVYLDFWGRGAPVLLTPSPLGL